MRREMLNFRVYLVLFSVSVLWLLPNSAMAEGDGAWTTTASPGYTFLVEEDLFNNEKHMSMTVLKPGYVGGETYWGSTSGSVGSTYSLKSLSADSDMMVTWEFNGVTQATVTVESCTTNCLWQPGQVVTLNKFFGDMKDDPKIVSRVPKTGQTQCWDAAGNSISCAGTGQDGEYQLGLLPPVPPAVGNGIAGTDPYTVYGWTGTRFTDNQNGTVTDNVTGLIWLKDSNCFGERTWQEALNIASMLQNGLCGLNDGSAAGDWRLPNINELHSLVDPSKHTPALPAGHPFSFSRYWFYWSSTSFNYDRFSHADLVPDWAWIVGFSDGMVTVADKAWPDPLSVWPVR